MDAFTYRVVGILVNDDVKMEVGIAKGPLVQFLHGTSGRETGRAITPQLHYMYKYWMHSLYTCTFVSDRA